MALKKTVTSLDEVPEAIRGEYTKVEVEGKPAYYSLVVEGEEDTGALKRALERVREERDTKIAELKAKGEDVTALENSYKDKIASLEAESKKAVEATAKALRIATKDAQASALAKRLSADSDEVLLPHIEKRLRVEIVDEKPIVRVLDKDGKMSAASLADLEKEFRDNPRFAAVITGSRGSGSGAGSEQHSSGGTGGDSGQVNPNNMSPSQLAKWSADRAATRRR